MKLKWILIPILILLLVSCVSATWWNNDWEKRKVGTISDPETTFSGYEIYFQVNYSAGMQADFDDIRFVAANDTTELSCWVEDKTDSDHAHVWVESAEDDTTIYMYYDHDDAASSSSGENTFRIYDDFQDGVINTTLWDIAGTPSEYGGSVIFDSTTDSIKSKLTWGLGYSLLFFASMSTDGYGEAGFSSDYGTATSNVAEFIGYNSNSIKAVSYVSDSGTADVIGAYGGSNYRWEVARVDLATDENRYYREFGLAHTDTTYVLTTAKPVMFEDTTNGGMNVGYVLVRHVKGTEPTIAWGAAQANIIADFQANETIICPFDVVEFTDTTTGSPTAWYWDFGDSNTSTDQNPTHEYWTPGLYDVELNASNSVGFDWENKSIYISVRSPVDALFTGFPTVGSVPLDVMFTDASTGDGITAWNWSFGDGNFSNLQNPDHVYYTAGTYNVSLTTTGTCGDDVYTIIGYITIFGGGGTSTPTPTPTAEPVTITTTPPASSMNIGERVVSTEDTFIPFWLWALITSCAVGAFLVGAMGYRVIFGTLSMVLFSASAFASPIVGFFYSETILTNITLNNYNTYPIVQTIMQPWLAWLMWGMVLLSLILLVHGIIEGAESIKKPGDEFLEDEWLEKRGNL